MRLLTLEAWLSLVRYKMRAALAIIGIASGVATVILVVAIGTAGKNTAIGALEALVGEAGNWNTQFRGVSPDYPAIRR